MTVAIVTVVLIMIVLGVLILVILALRRMSNKWVQMVKSLGIQAKTSYIQVVYDTSATGFFFLTEHTSISHTNSTGLDASLEH